MKTNAHHFLFTYQCQDCNVITENVVFKNVEAGYGWGCENCDTHKDLLIRKIEKVVYDE